MNAFTHTRQTIQQLHQAHADYIEAMYTGLSQIPDNPYGVIIRKFSETRTFLHRQGDFSNRIILTGNESPELLDEIILHFSNNTSACFIEINPANFSHSQPPNTDQLLMPHFLERGFQVGDMRCVWIYDDTRMSNARPSHQHIRIETFASDEIDLYYPLQLQVLNHDYDEDEKTAITYRHSVGTWHNYVAYIDGTPAGLATLLISGEIGYLVWGFTQEKFRRLGCHAALIQKRVEDAMNAGCSTIFSVSDVDANSVFSLQANGLVIAYNYMLMERWFQ